VILVVALLVALLALDCSGGSAAPSGSRSTPARGGIPPTATFTIHGSIRAPNCSGYAIENVPVTVRNETGTVIASGQTGTPDPITAATNYECETHYTVTVPLAQLYQVRVGTHDGPGTRFDALQAQGWRLLYVLGP
jgi:hypothetical protein